MIKNFDLFFDLKKKGKASLFCGAFALLWIILWAVFPMAFYSLFFDSAAGSNVFLLALELVLIIPLNLMFSKIVKGNISMFFTLISDIIFMTAAAYTFSIFRYSQVIWVILVILLHLLSKLFIDGKPYEGDNVKISLLKRKPLSAALTALAHTAAADSLLLLLMYTSAHIFAD